MFFSRIKNNNVYPCKQQFYFIKVCSGLILMGSKLYRHVFVMRCGAVVKRRTRDREVPGSIPTNCKCCFLEQETLSTLLSTGFYPGKKRATWKISTRLLNVLPSINKVDYYYYYYYALHQILGDFFTPKVLTCYLFFHINMLSRLEASCMLLILVRRQHIFLILIRSPIWWTHNICFRGEIRKILI